MIQDNVLVAHAEFHYLQTRQSKKKVECALNIDIQKVYERIEWYFLIKMMEQRGFQIRWVRTCIS